MSKTAKRKERLENMPVSKKRSHNTTKGVREVEKNQTMKLSNKKEMKFPKGKNINSQTEETVKQLRTGVLTCITPQAEDKKWTLEKKVQ